MSNNEVYVLKANSKIPDKPTFVEENTTIDDPSFVGVKKFSPSYVVYKPI